MSTTYTWSADLARGVGAVVLMIVEFGGWQASARRDKDPAGGKFSVGGCVVAGLRHWQRTIRKRQTGSKSAMWRGVQLVFMFVSFRKGC